MILTTHLNLLACNSGKVRLHTTASFILFVTVKRLKLNTKAGWLHITIHSQYHSISVSLNLMIISVVMATKDHTLCPRTSTWEPGNTLVQDHSSSLHLNISLPLSADELLMSALWCSLGTGVGAASGEGAGGLLDEDSRIWTKLPGNTPRFPFSTPSHHPSPTCVR